MFYGKLKIDKYTFVMDRLGLGVKLNGRNRFFVPLEKLKQDLEIISGFNFHIDENNSFYILHKNEKYLLLK